MVCRRLSFGTKEEAVAYSRTLAEFRHPYECRYCDQWHLGLNRAGKIQMIASLGILDSVQHVVERKTRRAKRIVDRKKDRRRSKDNGE